jgi:hypothetical protein
VPGWVSGEVCIARTATAGITRSRIRP